MAELFWKNENNYNFIKSDNIKIFPCAFRGQKEDGTVIDPEALLNTEANLVSLSSIAENKSRLINWSGNNLKISILGYTINITASLSEVQALGETIYLVAKVGNKQLNDKTNTKVLTNLNTVGSGNNNDIPLDELQAAEYYFTGLAFTNDVAEFSEANDVGIISLLQNNEIDYSSTLPIIKSGKKENTVLIGENAIENENTKIAINDGSSIDNAIEFDGTDVKVNRNILMNNKNINNINNLISKTSTIDELNSSKINGDKINLKNNVSLSSEDGLNLNNTGIVSAGPIEAEEIALNNGPYISSSGITVNANGKITFSGSNNLVIAQKSINDVEEILFMDDLSINNSEGINMANLPISAVDTITLSAGSQSSGININNRAITNVNNFKVKDTSSNKEQSGVTINTNTTGPEINATKMSSTFTETRNGFDLSGGGQLVNTEEKNELEINFNDSSIKAHSKYKTTVGAQPIITTNETILNAAGVTTTGNVKANNFTYSDGTDLNSTYYIKNGKNKTELFNSWASSKNYISFADPGFSTLKFYIQGIGSEQNENGVQIEFPFIEGNVVSLHGKSTYLASTQTVNTSNEVFSLVLILEIPSDSSNWKVSLKLITHGMGATSVEVLTKDNYERLLTKAIPDSSEDLLWKLILENA